MSRHLLINFLSFIITTFSFSQIKDVKLNVNLTSCFDKESIKWYFGDITNHDQKIEISPDSKSVKLSLGLEYELKIYTEQFNEFYTRKIILTPADYKIEINDCIGDSIPIEKLGISELNALSDIENDSIKIFTYPDLSDQLTKMAWKYGCPYTILNLIAKQYHFEFVSTGCELNENYRQGFSRYNNQIIKYFNSKYPKNWINLMEEKIQSELIKNKPFYKRRAYKKDVSKLILNK